MPAPAADLPLANFRARISAAIDRHIANAAGTVAGVSVRGCWRRGSDIVGTEWGGRIGGTLITYTVDAAVLAGAFGGQPAAQSPAGHWYEGPGQALAYTNDGGQILTNGTDEPLLSVERRASGAQVIITAGEGIGAYTIAEVQPADGGRVRLVLEVA